jgi:nitroreductase
MRQDMCPEADYKSFPPPDKLESMLRLRRSVRRFDNRLPGKTSLERAIRLAGYAPSSHNSQPVRWMVFARREALHRLSAMAVEGMKHDMERRPAASHAPVFKKIVAAWDAGRDLLLHDAPCLVVVHSKIRTGAESTDAAIALAQFNLAAMSFGLGCCWAGLFVEATNVWRPLGDALKLPKNHQLHGAMVVGYPAVEFKRLPERRTPTIMWQ